MDDNRKEYAVPCTPLVRAQGGVPQLGLVMTTGAATDVSVTARLAHEDKVSHTWTVNGKFPELISVP